MAKFSGHDSKAYIFRHTSQRARSGAIATNVCVLVESGCAPGTLATEFAELMVIGKSKICCCLAKISK